MTERKLNSGIRLSWLGQGNISLLIRGLNALLLFLVSLTLARILAPSGYGLYTWVHTVLLFLSVLAQVGLPKFLIREIAMISGERPGESHWLVRWALLREFTVSLLIVLGLGFGILVVSVVSESPKIPVLLLGLILVPLLAFSQTVAAVLKGLKRVLVGQLPYDVVRPLVFLVLILVVYGGSNSGPLSPAIAVLLHGVGALCALIFGGIVLKRSRIWTSPIIEPTTGLSRAERHNSTVLFLGIGLLQLVNQQFDILMLGFYVSDQETGIYRAVYQLNILITFGLLAINQIIQPHVANLYYRQEWRTLQRLVKRSALVVLCLATPPAILLFSFGDQVITLLYGEKYSLGFSVLKILVVGQLFNALFGSVALLLNMTGNERYTYRSLILSGALNIVINSLLIPVLGMQGAAIASVSSLLAWNAAMSFFVFRALGIDSTAFLGRLSLPVYRALGRILDGKA